MGAIGGSQSQARWKLGEKIILSDSETVGWAMHEARIQKRRGALLSLGS